MNSVDEVDENDEDDYQIDRDNDDAKTSHLGSVAVSR